MGIDPNALSYNTFRPIPGWSLLLFAGFCAGLVMLGLRLWPAPTMLSALGIFFGAGLAAAFLSVAPLGRAALPALGLRRVDWRYAVFGTVGTLAISIVVSQLGIEPDGVKQAMEIAGDPEQFLLSLVILAVLAPLVEEVVFRGLLYGWLEARLGSSVAFVVSSLAFAAAHLEPKHVVLVLPLGLLFGWLRRRSNSLAPSIVAHIVNNGFALTASAYFGI